jgi:hypothetical protein
MRTKPESQSTARILPRWGWVLAILFYPVGPFVAFGAARLLKWWMAVCLAVVAYGITAGLAFGMSRVPEESVAQGFILLAGSIGLVGMGWYQFRIGDKADYWSDDARRIWCIFGWIGAMAVVCALGTMLVYVSLAGRSA